jgi:pimeloyl-ACP methyl ester carboxylesterase
VLLAGHSYGGAVISNAAANAPNVVGLVFVAAFAPEECRGVDLSAAVMGCRVGWIWMCGTGGRSW